MIIREALTQKGFVEINTPKLIGGESEGGSEVFRTDYFGQVRRVMSACFCLSLSPDLPLYMIL